MGYTLPFWPSHCKQWCGASKRAMSLMGQSRKCSCLHGTSVVPSRADVGRPRPKFILSLTSQAIPIPLSSRNALASSRACSRVKISGRIRRLGKRVRNGWRSPGGLREATEWPQGRRVEVAYRTTTRPTGGLEGSVFFLAFVPIHTDAEMCVVNRGRGDSNASIQRW